MNATTQTRPAGDDSDFVEYVRTRRPMLLGYAYAITGNASDAEDLVQTGLAKTYLAWGRIKEKGAVDTYVRQVLSNTRISWWRRRRGIRECPLDHLPDRAASRDAFAEHDLRDVLWTALSRLSKQQRAIVVLRYYSSLSEKETAATLGVSTGTVKSTMHRALAKLRIDDTLRAHAFTDRPQLTLAG